ncbi:growth hormone secretagogue receptor type 1 [Plakobranchus ocellatus]|uniref:Growth hormone secretagogue receptor type 1 n=1 Tax=Plakobranchus ocellatus TaxID=259542 RepID=A0AAV3XVX8_9GAST|nr:growth hormone secretagogue receptor type 1 [Plakobranchus ocellatus]
MEQTDIVRRSKSPWLSPLHMVPIPQNSWIPFNDYSPQQGNLRLSGPPSGQGAGGGARTRDRMVPADLRADSLATVPPTPPKHCEERGFLQ